MESHHQEYKIAGHTVLFPCKPYPSQFSMMDKIIKGIERHQNCLLESPTGSGKSLSLLCSSLAWQAAEKRKQAEEAQMKLDGMSPECQCGCHNEKRNSDPHQSSAARAPAATVSATSVPSLSCSTQPLGLGTRKSSALTTGDGDTSIVLDNDSDEDFQPLKKFKETKKSKVSTQKRSRLSVEYEQSHPAYPFSSTSANSASSKILTNPSTSTMSPCSHCDCQNRVQKGTPRKVPKIFFGTRTHKQVAQIVRELRKTAYHDVAMTILASREYTCIHPQVTTSGSKNEGCEDLLKNVGCCFKDRVPKYQSQSAIKAVGLHSAWDLEDLVDLMKKKKACPYFLSRGLKDQADLIICPYNYLVDPLIRESMEVNLKGQIVLLDEAHNIEDSVREAASQSITQEQIQRVLHDMDILIEKGVKIADISKLRQMCHKLDMFIEDQSSLLTQHDFEQSYRMWSGFEIIAQLQQLDLGPQAYEQLKATLSSIKAAEQEERQYTAGQEHHTLSSSACSLLEQVFLVLRYLYRDNMKHAEDYRASVVKSIQYVSSRLNGSWLNSKKNYGGRKTPEEVFTLNFWCMNPAVGFADFECCRTVILTSGTLSPMDSFQSELGLPFPIILEANHIIKDSQVWVGAIGEGPGGQPLQAVYRNMETYDFQDSLGNLILGVCRTVPKGVLCFLPSYRSLEKLTMRWKSTGVWSTIENHKHILSEPRGSDKAEFEQVMQIFCKIVKGSEANEDGANRVDGALLFAVCRGKVSEGMDFADDSARAVISVGIPYPNYKDIQVELKRKYNDRYEASRGLLSGHLWYEIQAFRALNQALGRCIRHKNDWGALIIVDARFIKNTGKYANGLSKWVRQKLRVHHNYSSMLESLSDFTKARLQADEQANRTGISQWPSASTTPTFESGTCSSAKAHRPNHYTSLPELRPALQDVSNVATSTAIPVLQVINTQTPLKVLLTKTDGTEIISSTHCVESGNIERNVASSSNAGKNNQPSCNDKIVPSAQQAVARSALERKCSALLSHSGVQGHEIGLTKGQMAGNIDTDVVITAVYQNGMPPSSVYIDKTENNTVSQSSPTAQAVAIASKPRTVHMVTAVPATSLCSGIVGAPKGAVNSLNTSRSDSSGFLHGHLVSPASPAIHCNSNPVSQILLRPVTVINSANIRQPIPDVQLLPNHPRFMKSLLSGSINRVTYPVPHTATNNKLNVEDHLRTASDGIIQSSQVPVQPSQISLQPSNSLVQPSQVPLQPSQSPVQPSQSSVQPSKAPSRHANSEASDVLGKMMYVPVTSCTFKPTLLVLPIVSSKQTLLKLLPDFHKALGIEVLLVPAGIQHVVLANSLEQAVALFQSSQMNAQSTQVASIASPMKSPVVSNVHLISSKQQSGTVTVQYKTSPVMSATSNCSAGKNRSQASDSDTSQSLFSDSENVQSRVLKNTSVGQAELGSELIATDASELCPVSPWPAISSALTSSLSVKTLSPRVLPSPSETSTYTGSRDDTSLALVPQSQGPDKEIGKGNRKLLQRKRLFKKSAVQGHQDTDSSTLLDQLAEVSTGDTKGVADNSASKGSALPLSMKVAASSPPDPEKNDIRGEGEEKIVRRVKGVKRRSSRLMSRRSKKQDCNDNLDKGREEPRHTLQCAACGYLLLDDIRESDFERRNNMPTCLVGMADPNKPEVLYFKGHAIMERLNLPVTAVGDCRSQQSSADVEAKVQLIYCSGCRDDVFLSTASLLGAKVTLTSSAGSTGQMWIFTHKVTLILKDTHL